MNSLRRPVVEPACSYCGQYCLNLEVHYVNCRELFGRKVYQTLAKFNDIIFYPLGYTPIRAQHKRTAQIASVKRLYDTLPNDTPSHQQRAVSYARSVIRPVAGRRAGDPQTGGVTFLKKGGE